MPVSFKRLRLQRFDPEALLNAISSTDMEQRILVRGDLCIDLQRLVLGDLTINSGDYSFSIFARGGIPHGHVHIGLLITASDVVRVNNEVIPVDQLQLYTPGCELQYATRAGTRWAVLELPLEQLQSVANAQGLGELDWPRQGVRYVDLPPRVAKAIRREVRSLLEIGRRFSGLSDDDMVESTVSEELVIMLAQAIADRSPSPKSLGRLSAGQQHALGILERNIDRWEANSSRSPQLKELGGATQRMLERATQRAYGMTPHYWLNLARLNTAYRDILTGRSTSVTEVCQRWGFGHIGRFAIHYRALFGESPGQTIKRVQESNAK